jgi:tetratricopeptide (TPR) repeat protein
LYNAGSLASARKQYAEAEQFFLKSASLLEKTLPPGHPDIGRVLANLGDLYRTQKRLAESAVIYGRGLEILVKAWGPDDQRLLDWLERYVQVLRAREDYAEAARLDLQATRIRVTHTLR